MKKICLCFFSAILICALVACHPFGESMNYMEAKADATEILNKKKDVFETAVNEIVETKSVSNTNISGVESILYNEDKGNTIVVFYMKGYGLMTGGQYWGVYYSSDDNPYTNWGVELVSGSKQGCFYWQEEEAGNLYATERIEEGWFFYYEDYDGNSHELDWK